MHAIWRYFGNPSLSKLGKEIPKNQETALKQFWADQGMEIVGPPLKI